MDAIPNRSGSVEALTTRRFPYIKLLLILFLLSLPFVNPTVHGDGVGYYAYARAIMVQHNLRFEEDWRRANLNFSSKRTRADQRLTADQYTSTGYVDNHFSVGPAILWAPFLITAHAMVLTMDALGGSIPADGFSAPYRIAMALGTAVCGFLGLLFSFLLARKFVRDRWAFLATLGIWLASSLPVYMYFNPSWSHAHSAFTVALFLWFWERSRGSRKLLQWIGLGLIAGLMVDVYLPNGVFLSLPMIEGILEHRSLWEEARWDVQRRVFIGEAAFTISTLVALLPTFITRKLIFGGFFRLGAYTELPWDWSAG